MQKEISPKIIALTFGVLVIAFLAVFYVVAWTEPSQAPPLENVPTPLNVGASYQEKIGSLIINRGGAATGLVVEKGNVGIGTTTPTSKLEVKGGNIYISTAGKGLIIKGPNPYWCNKIIVDNFGVLSTLLVDCATGATGVPGAYCATDADCFGGLFCRGRYRDQDGDGYGLLTGYYAYMCSLPDSAPSGWAINAGDCYDLSANARPGQTAFFVVSRGDGSYDYDCDGQQTFRPGTMEYYCDSPCGIGYNNTCSTYIRYCRGVRTPAYCGGWQPYQSSGDPFAVYDTDPEAGPSCYIVGNYPTCSQVAGQTACR